MSSDRVQTEKLLQEYTALAPTYDARWAAYLSASLRMTVDEMTDLTADRVLDVACGTGQLLEQVAERFHFPELVGIDRVPAMLEVARRRLGSRATVHEGEAQNLPFVNADFQLVTSSNALHYFRDADAALREMRRVISPDGNLIITDWCRNYLSMKVLNRLLPWTAHAHTHTFSSSELRQSLHLAGFRVASETRRKIDSFWGLMTLRATPIF